MAQRLDELPRPARLALCALLGFLYGLVVSRIPASADPLALQAGYFVAPWLVLPFVAGWLQRSAPWAVVAGVLVGVVCMFGFYLNAFPEYHPAYIALKGTASGIRLVLGGAVLWVTVYAMWYVIATATGIVFGLLGHWWRAAGSPVPVIILAVFFVLEPLAHLVLAGGLPRPYAVWVLEVAAALVLPTWAAIARQRRSVSLA